MNLNPEFRVNIPKHDKGLLRVRVFGGPNGLDIQPEGYGDFSSENGYGSPIFLEHTEDGLRLIVWSDINEPEPTHIISLEGAKESVRSES